NRSPVQGFICDILVGVRLIERIHIMAASSHAPDHNAPATFVSVASHMREHGEQPTKTLANC
ncbi:MAG TPA: hypothetical protein VKE41_18515, partial [Roseiflexaceae bacterium]|nr:hypothetical protein [Roseiflexaceae bacterium]